jgi:multiple sugar transport system permease protein
VLGLALQDVQEVKMACADELNGPRLAMIGGSYLPVKDDYQDPHGAVRPVALVGDWQQMSPVIPVAAASDAYDVPEGELRPDTSPSLHWENFLNALSTKIGDANYLTFFRNTAILVVLNVVGSLISCTLVAYGFARLRAPGKSVLFLILLATMMLPFPVTMVPLYELFVRTGELTQQIGMFRIGQDTLWPLFLPAFFGNAFLIFLLRQFFMTIPRELEEAAVIDGANRVQVLWSIFLPLTKPALVTTIIFTFMGVWNDFMGPLVYLDSPRNFTVTLGLRFFMGQFTADYHLLMAASLVALLPMLILFFLGQRFFIEGITMTGIKG